MGYGAYFAKDKGVVNRCGRAMWVCFYIYMTMAIAFVLSLLTSLGAFNMMHTLDIIAIILGTIFLFGAWGCDLGISINDEEQMTKLADKCFKTIVVELIIYILIVWWVMPYVFSS